MPVAKLFVLGFGFIAITTMVNAIVILIAGRFVAAAKRNPRALRLFDYRLRGADERLRRASRLERSEIGAPNMDLAAFRASLSAAEPPAELGPGLAGALARRARRLGRRARRGAGRRGRGRRLGARLSASQGGRRRQCRRIGIAERASRSAAPRSTKNGRRSPTLF